MTQRDSEIITEIITKTVKALQAQPKKLEFSKKLMIFALVIYAASWIVAAVSWFYLEEFPSELMQYGSIAYGVIIAAYCGKSAYENKSKIEKED